MPKEIKKQAVEIPKKDLNRNPNKSEKQESKLKSEKKLAEPMQKKRDATKNISKETIKKYKEPSLKTSEISQKNKTKSMQKTNKGANDVYNIESLVKKQGSKYLVKWENYPADQNTWEPKASIPKFILKVIL